MTSIPYSVTETVLASPRYFSYSDSVSSTVPMEQIEIQYIFSELFILSSSASYAALILLRNILLHLGSQQPFRMALTPTVFSFFINNRHFGVPLSRCGTMSHHSVTIQQTDHKTRKGGSIVSSNKSRSNVDMAQQRAYNAPTPMDTLI